MLDTLQERASRDVVNRFELQKADRAAGNEKPDFFDPKKQHKPFFDWRVKPEIKYREAEIKLAQAVEAIDWVKCSYRQKMQFHALCKTYKNFARNVRPTAFQVTKILYFDFTTDLFWYKLYKS